jgi:hypothetical protein
MKFDDGSMPPLDIRFETSATQVAGNPKLLSFRAEDTSRNVVIAMEKDEKQKVVMFLAM